MKRILVVRFGSLGDVILSSPAVLNLKLSFPSASIIYLTKARFAPVAACIDGVDEVVCLDEEGGPAGLIRLLLKLDDRNFDAIVDLHGNPRSWLTRQIVRASGKAVYPKRRLDRMRLVRGGEKPFGWPHTIDLYNQAVTGVGGKIRAYRPGLLVDDDVPLPPGVESLLARHKLVVAVAPGAAHPNKQWPMERFCAVASGLHHRYGVGIVWAVTAESAGQGPSRREVTDGSVVELVDCPVPVLAAVIARCAVTVANDSGIGHLSSAVGTPVAAIFGPTHPALGFAPRGIYDRVIEVDEGCRPCSLHGKKPCYREERFCLTRIQAGDVVEVIGEIIQRMVELSPGLLVDRDGTLIVDKDYLSDPSEVELIPGAAEGIKEAQRRGFKVVVVSNQSGVARGRFGRDAVERVNARVNELLAGEGAKVDGIYYCPHYSGGTVAEYAIECDCRKPSPGMAERAAIDLGIDLRRTWVIGDKTDDVNLARVIGAGGVLVRTGYGAEHEGAVREMGRANRMWVAENLREAIRVILARGER